MIRPETNPTYEKFKVHEIGNKIKLRRTELSFSINDLAFLAQIEKEELMAYENGTREISGPLLNKLSVILGTSVDYFVQDINLVFP